MIVNTMDGTEESQIRLVDPQHVRRIRGIMMTMEDCAMRRKYMREEDGKIIFHDLPTLTAEEYIADVTELRRRVISDCFGSIRQMLRKVLPRLSLTIIIALCVWWMGVLNLAILIASIAIGSVVIPTIKFLLLERKSIRIFDSWIAEYKTNENI